MNRSPPRPDELELWSSKESRKMRKRKGAVQTRTMKEISSVQLNIDGRVGRGKGVGQSKESEQTRFRCTAFLPL
jgi:hypothetical protein